MISLVSLAGQPARAVNIKSYDLRWESWTTSLVITGQIKLDLDVVVGNLPFDNSGTPTGLPSWVDDLVIKVPGSGPGAGTFTRNDYNGLIWNNGNGSITYTFNADLVGQGDWGNTYACPAPGCNFRLLRSNAQAPYGDAPFQMYTAVGGTGDYLGLKSFAPSPPVPVPAPLPIGGAVALTHWSRRLRRRCRRSLSHRAPSRRG
jgi:hypothetical protein